MRKSALVILLGLALAALGCGGGDSPTEPGNRQARGNWIGTISGKNDLVPVNGTCALEMNLDTSLNGAWWIDCLNSPTRQGQVLTVPLDGNNVILTFFSTSSPQTCPWQGVASRTETRIEGDFEAEDCDTHASLGTGTFELRRR